MLSRLNGIKSFLISLVSYFLCFKSNEFDFSSIFSFHVKRIGECILDISSIEKFEGEIYVEILN